MDPAKNQQEIIKKNQSSEEVQPDSEEEIVRSEIESLNRALDKITEIESSSGENSLLSVITHSEIDFSEDVSESVSFYFETAIQSPETQSLFEEGVEKEALSNTGSLISAINQARSSAASFLSKIFRNSLKLSNESSHLTIPSINSAEDARVEPLVDAEALQNAEDTADELENQGAAGTIHLSALGHITGRRIIVFSSNMNIINHQEAGRSQSGPPVEIQYHTPRAGQIHGHWTLIGDRDPEFIEGSLNDCLFVAVAAQTGRMPNELRAETVQYLRRHLNSLAARIQQLVRAHECDEIILLIGGARYSGNSPRDAQRILDNSQLGRCHPGHQQGHPRGHASNPSATGTTESVENYSRSGWKTGFLSRGDQDMVTNLALNTPQAQRAMDQLNNGGTSQSINIDASQLPGQLPQAAEFNNGVMGQPQPIRSLTIVMRHHAGHANDPNHDVFVHTTYPRL